MQEKIEQKLMRLKIEKQEKKMKPKASF